MQVQSYALSPVSNVVTLCEMSPSPHDDDSESPRFGRRTRSRLSLFELRCWQIDFVPLFVDVHGLGTKSGRYGLHSLPFATFILHNTETAFPVLANA